MYGGGLSEHGSDTPSLLGRYLLIPTNRVASLCFCGRMLCFDLIFWFSPGSLKHASAATAGTKIETCISSTLVFRVYASCEVENRTPLTLIIALAQAKVWPFASPQLSGVLSKAACLSIT